MTNECTLMTNECPLIRYCDTADRALFYSEVFNAERALGKNPFLLVCGSTGGGAGAGPGSASDKGHRGVSDEGGNQGAGGFDKGCGTYGTSNGARDGADARDGAGGANGSTSNGARDGADARDGAGGANGSISNGARDGADARDGAGGGANGSISTVQSARDGAGGGANGSISTIQSESISTPELHSTAPPSVMTWLANLKLNLHANFGSGRVRRVSEELTATLGHAMEGDLQSKVCYRGVPLDMDVIDTSWMDSNVHALRHNYFNVNRWMLDDIRDTVVTRRRAHLRAGGLTHRRGNVWSFVGAPKYIVNP
jgi:hypothetical protein